MGKGFDFVEGRPDFISEILNGLDRYNPGTTTVFQDYVTTQCEERSYDCYANLALLKLYQFNPHLARDEVITNILVKALMNFPTPDFSLCLHLLPPHILASSSTSASLPAAGDAPLTEAVQKLTVLNTLLSQADYRRFWSTLDSDDLYADLVADVSGFEEEMRVKIAFIVGQSCRELQRAVLEEWLQMKGNEFAQFITNVVGWKVDEGRGMVEIPPTKENEAKGTVVRENVNFDQFSRIIKRSYEQPA
ncbi:hypothetical protein MMC25_002337 [Agyrium rufum]|nr:hypothetical protein [Agyrium rufum]